MRRSFEVWTQCKIWNRWFRVRERAGFRLMIRRVWQIVFENHLENSSSSCHKLRKWHWIWCKVQMKHWKVKRTFKLLYHLLEEMKLRFDLTRQQCKVWKLMERNNQSSSLPVDELNEVNQFCSRNLLLEKNHKWSW